MAEDTRHVPKRDDVNIDGVKGCVRDQEKYRQVFAKFGDLMAESVETATKQEYLEVRLIDGP